MNSPDSNVIEDSDVWLEEWWHEPGATDGEEPERFRLVVSRPLPTRAIGAKPPYVPIRVRHESDKKLVNRAEDETP